MQRFFYINAALLFESGVMVKTIRGYFTDAQHNMFFPPIDISRNEALEILKRGDILFIEDKHNGKQQINLVTVDKVAYLRADRKKLPKDYFGDRSVL